jgi:16S rRNA (cytosine967-C5)-methyltransferase
VPAHAAVSTSVELARATVGERVAGYVNQALRKIAARGSHAAVGTHPEWLVARWAARFGEEETQQLLAWNDSKPELIVQPARSYPKSLICEFRERGLWAEEAPFGAGVRVKGVAKDLPGFTEGAFIVQDPAHALVSRFAAIPRGEVVYDACAAPGGKAVALEAQGARVLAGDARRERLGRLLDTTRRAGVEIHCLAADLVAAPIRPGGVDAVLVDAPCSATGTIRRHPDARWRLDPAIFARAASRQARLLAAAAPLVRSGGLLIYATCSLEPEENERVVEDFLNRNPGFVRAPRGDASFPTELLTHAGDFQSLPHRHGIDGAYAARLVRLS